MYREIKSSIGLEPLIDAFWTFSSNKASERFKILPDNCVDLIFDLKENKAFVSGVMTRYKSRKIGANSDLIGLRFKAENFGVISKVPLIETRNQRIELSHVIPDIDSNFLTRLIGITETEEKKHFLEQFILKTIKEQNYISNTLINSVANQIRLSRGVVGVNDLAKSHHVSLRQLERRFKTQIGMTLKEFSNIIRFNNAKKSIAELDKTSLLEIAYSTGFFDHSHLTYEFNRISGENPSHFR